MVTLVDLACVVCGKPFRRSQPWAKYCSSDCRLSVGSTPRAPVPARPCRVCGIEFRPIRDSGVYCSKACRSEFNKSFYVPHKEIAPNMSTGTTGAVSELIAASDLTLRGYDVFRAVSPAAPCDLIAIRGDRLVRVEVRTGYRNRDGSINHRPTPKDSGRQDCFAVVDIISRAVIYMPETAIS